MGTPRFDPVGSLAVLGEIVRLTAPPAGRSEICEQGLALTAKALGLGGAALLERPAGESPLEVRCAWGTCDAEAARRVAERAISSSSTATDGGAEGGVPERVALVLPGDTGPIGAIALERPTDWGPSARLFARSAARAIAAALRAAAVIEEIRDQGEILARRNAELEALREFIDRVQDRGSEGEILEASLDLVLEKLGLGAGWIFWGEEKKGQLELAAARGVSPGFVRRSRESGIGTCLCQDVFRTGRLAFARNTTECPRMPELLLGGESPAHACIPLKFERGVLGVMNIANRPGRVFTGEELHFLETFGKQLCLAIDKARAARAELHRNAEARALASLTRAIGGSLEQEEVLAAVGNYGRKLLAADRCSIFLGDGDGPLRFAFLAGPPLEGLEVGRPADLPGLGSRAILEALRERQTVVVPDTDTDPRANADLARQWGIRSLIAVPLVAHERREGVMVADRARASTWSVDEVEVASALAGQAALSIENARLYREAKDALFRLQQAQYGMMRAERMAAVGTLAASLAHEVRNPLNSINLQLVLLARRVGRLEGDRREEIGGIIDGARREIARLDGLVEEFLSLSTIDRLALEATHPNEVMREVLGLMAPGARLRGIEVAEELAPDLPPLRLDREKIKQVLINLVRNAIEAMPEPGRLTVASRQVDRTVVISVADTGVGIEPGLDVFDFFTTTKRGGTGLGLPIARRIVEGHGGSLTYRSTPGRGTVFQMTLKMPDDGAEARSQR
jgi:two-component system sensor histidine kinase HydH